MRLRREQPIRDCCRRLAFSFLAVLGAAVGGCSDSAAIKAELCDGREGWTLALRYSIRATDIADSVALSNGAAYLYVSGPCEYWVNDNQWWPRQGKLSANDKAALVEAIRYDDLTQIQGVWRTTGCSLESVLDIAADKGRGTCICNCYSSSTPAAVNQINGDRLWSLLDGLLAKGQVSSGPARLSLLETSDPPSETMPWPQAYDIEDYLVPLEPLVDATTASQRATPDGGVAIGAELARELRQMGAEYLGGLGWADSRLPVSAGGKVYYATLADQLPYENPF